MTFTPNFIDVVPLELADIAFVVGGELNSTDRQGFRCMKGPLRLHSKAMNAMLAGSWKEATQETPLDLPDDDPAAFHLLLRIMNVQIGPLSRPIAPVQELVDLAGLADKWGCTGLVRDCIAAWTRVAIEADEDCLRPDEQCYIAWIIGLRELFESAWLKLVDNCFYHPNHGWSVHSTLKPRCPWFNCQSIATGLLWDDAITEITQAASSKLHDLHVRMQLFVFDTTHHGIGIQCLASNHTNAQKCRDSMTHCVSQTLVHYGIPILPTRGAIQASPSPNIEGNSVAWIAAQLRDDLFYPYRKRGHEPCMSPPSWNHRLRAVMEKPVPMTARQEEHFKLFR